MKIIVSSFLNAYLQYFLRLVPLKNNPIAKQAPLTELQHNRLTRIAVSCFFFCQGICFASWASRIPTIKDNLHLTDAGLGSILLLLPAGQLTAMPFSGRIIARFGSKNVIRLCAPLYAIALTNMGFAQNSWQLALALFLFGIVGNMANISVNTQAILTEKQFNRPIMTSFHGVWSAAGFVGALIGIFMTSRHIAPYTHFWITTGLVFIITIGAQKYLNTGRSEEAAKKKFLSRPDAILMQLGLIGFCSMAAEGAMFDWSGVYFKQVVQAPPSLIILGYASFMVMMATGRFLGDKIIHQYGRKKTLQWSGLLISFGLFLSVFFPHIVTATIGFFIVGLGVSSVVPTVYSSVGRVSKISPSIALASVSSISYLGFLMGPPLIGYISELANLQYSFAVIGLLGFAITFMVTKLKGLLH